MKALCLLLVPSVPLLCRAKLPRQPARQQLKPRLLGAFGDQDVRFVSALPAQSIPGYQTANARFGWTLRRHLVLAANGRILLQPHHPEFSGDDGNKVGIRRSFHASLTWQS